MEDSGSEEKRQAVWDEIVLKSLQDAAYVQEELLNMVCMYVFYVSCLHPCLFVGLTYIIYIYI